MWPETFRILSRQKESLGHALLKRDVLSQATPRFERASVVMASRVAAASRRSDQRFIFMAPPPCDYLGCVISAGLLIADFAYRMMPASVPPGESGTLLDGDLLVITHAVGETVERLGGLSLGGEKIQDYWYVGSYSRYYRSHGKARVFVANPGWVMDGIPGRRIYGLVIDATHPRTLSKTLMLLERIGKPPLQIIVTSPLLKADLSNLGYPEKAKLWLWDPEAKKNIDEVVSGLPAPSLGAGKRSIWVCQDPEVDEALAGVHDLLSSCKTISGQPMPAVWEAWALLQRFRQLAVPLAQIEDSTFRVWGALSFGKRLERLKNEWPDTFSVEVRWPKIIEGLHSVYDLLRKRQEPAKFWALAERAETYLKQGARKLRIVVPTEHEGTILNVNLDCVISGWLRAQQDGSIEVVSAKEEARRVSQGESKPTLLAGSRSGAQRYLDVYPDYPTEVVAYPYEADLDVAQQERIYDFVEGLQGDRKRAETLSALGFPAGSGPEAGKSPRPVVHVEGTVTDRVRKARIVVPEPASLDLEQLAGSGVSASWDDEPRAEVELREGTYRKREKDVIVTYPDGRVVEYATWQMVDVYHPGTGDIERVNACDLKPGMQVILLVDGLYESLYDRLLEALRVRLGVYTKMVLLMWDKAKAELLKKHNGRRKDLYLHLLGKGLAVDYTTLLAWFRNESLYPQLSLGFGGSSGKRSSEIIAPQQYENMKILAEDCGQYPSEGMIKETFRAIQEERGRRRKAGHALHELLRAIASGEGYDRALKGARELGSEVGDVMAAVDVQPVREIRIAAHRMSGVV